MCLVGWIEKWKDEKYSLYAFTIKEKWCKSIKNKKFLTSITLYPTFSLQFKKRIFVARVKNAHPFALSSTKQQKTSHFLSFPFFPPYFLPNQIDHYFPSIFVAYHFLSNCAIDRAKVLLVKAVLNYIPFNTKSYLKTKILSKVYQHL